VSLSDRQVEELLDTRIEVPERSGNWKPIREFLHCTMHYSKQDVLRAISWAAITQAKLGGSLAPAVPDTRPVIVFGVCRGDIPILCNDVQEAERNANRMATDNPGSSVYIARVFARRVARMVVEDLPVAPAPEADKPRA
jgi:hypothetical protein